MGQHKGSHICTSPKQKWSRPGGRRQGGLCLFPRQWTGGGKDTFQLLCALPAAARKALYGP